MEIKEYAGFSQELVNMAINDQRMRIDSQDGKTDFDENLDLKNAQRLKEIVEKIGWPSIDKVGEEASYAAWLIVQHADFDITFQERCLNLMREVEKGEILPANIAYLADRIAVNRGEEQIYGTQFFTSDDGEIKPRSIKDIAGLELRRAEMGLEPFDLYSQKMKGLFDYPEGYKNPTVGRLFKAS